MIEHLFNSLIPTLEHLGLLSYWLVGLLFFTEAIVFVGLIIPGAVLAFLLGALAARGVFDLGDLVFFASLGFALGDALSYWLGWRGGGLFRAENRLLKEAHLKRGQAFFARHGNKSVILGRYIGIFRPLVPFLAGLGRMPFVRFFWLNLLGIVSWSALHLAAGYFFGQALGLIKLWTTRLEFSLILAGLFFGLFYLLKWLFVRKGELFWRAVNDALKARTKKLRHLPRLERLVAAHPAFFAWLHRRLTRKKFTGLPLTLFSLAGSYLALLLLGLVEDVLTADPITRADLWLDTALVSFRHPLLIKFFLLVTTLAKAEVVLILALATSLFFLIANQRRWLPGLWLAIGGSASFAYLGKVAIERPRPLGGFYQETGYAFPSAHAALAVAFFGFWLYWLWRRSDWSKRVNLVFVWLVLTLLIGFSRLYLGVHFLSDVLAGYLLGGLWLLSAIALSEWLLRRRDVSAYFQPLTLATKRWLVPLGLAALFAYAGLATAFIRTVNTARLEPLAAKSVEKLEPTLAGLPPDRFMETIDGAVIQPLNLVVVASSSAELEIAFRRAGWRPADDLSLVSLKKSLKAWVWQKNYAQAPVNPGFWRNQPNQLAFERPDDSHRRQGRWQVRLWPSNLSLADGRQIFFAAASRDTGRRWWLLGRLIEPEVDQARTRLSEDLAGQKLLNSGRELEWTEKNEKIGGGRNYLTDGRLLILYLK